MRPLPCSLCKEEGKVLTTFALAPAVQGCLVLEKADLGDLHSWLVDNFKYLHDTQFVSYFLEITKGEWGHLTIPSSLSS